jgi:hypothetical protein
MSTLTEHEIDQIVRQQTVNPLTTSKEKRRQAAKALMVECLNDAHETLHSCAIDYRVEHVPVIAVALFNHRNR